jgi:hypothetical protein
MPATFKIVPRRSTYIAGDLVVAKVLLVNAGPGAVEVPAPSYPPSQQPVYELVGPDGRSTFTPRQIAGIDADMKPLLLRLAPGETWEGDVRIGASAPGGYRIGGSIEWGGTRIVASPATFEVVPASLRGVVVAASSREPGDSFCIAQAIQRGPRQLELAAAILREDAHGAELDGPVLWGPLPGDTERLLEVYSNFNELRNPLSWFGAITPRGLHLGNDLSAKTTFVRAPRPIRAVPKALGFGDSSLVVLAILEGKTGGAPSALAMVTLPEPERWPNEVSLVDVASLGAPPVDAATTAGYGPGAPILLATTAPSSEPASERGGGGTRLELRRLDRTGRAGEPLVLELPDELPEPGLAVLAGSSGIVRVLLVTRACASPGTRTVSVVEATLGGELLRTAAVTIEGLAILPEPLLPVGAHAWLFEHAPGRVEGGVVLFPRDELPPVIWSLGGGAPREAPGLRPLRSGGAIIPGARGAYAVWVGDSGSLETGLL